MTTPTRDSRRHDLLTAIRTQPGAWTTSRAAAYYRAVGYLGPRTRMVRRDLAVLAAHGHLVRGADSAGVVFMPNSEAPSCH